MNMTDINKYLDLHLQNSKKTDELDKQTYFDNMNNIQTIIIKFDIDYNGKGLFIKQIDDDKVRFAIFDYEYNEYHSIDNGYNFNYTFNNNYKDFDLIKNFKLLSFIKDIIYNPNFKYLDLKKYNFYSF